MKKIQLNTNENTPRWKTLLLVSSLLLGTHQIFAQVYPSLITKQIAIGGSRREDIGDGFTNQPSTILQDRRGDIIIGITTHSNDGDIREARNPGVFVYKPDIFAIKINGQTGDTTWVSRALGGSEWESVHDVQGSADGDYYLMGLSGSLDGDGKGPYDKGGGGWVVKLDGSTGDTLWTSITLGTAGGSIDKTFKAVEIKDRSLIVACPSHTNTWQVSDHHGAGTNDVVLMKLDGLNGKIHWVSKSLGGTEEEDIVGIYKSGDTSVVVIVSTNSVDGDVHGQHGDQDIWVIKINTNNGNVIWTSRCLGGSGKDLANSAVIDTEGDIIIVGSTHSSDGDIKSKCGEKDGWIIKLEGATGDTLWTTRGLGSKADDYLGTYETHTIAALDSNRFYTKRQNVFIDRGGNIVAAGMTENTLNQKDIKNAKGGIDYWLVRVDANTGNVLAFSEAIGGDKHELLQHVVPTFDGGYLLSGKTTTSIASGNVLETEDIPEGTRSRWTAYVDSAFNFQWSRSFTDGENQYGDCGTYPTLGGFISVGLTIEQTAQGDKTVIGRGKEEDVDNSIPDIWVFKFEWLEGDFDAPLEACIGEPVQFNDNTKGKETAQPGVKWYWDFGDGVTDTIENPTHVYFEPGRYIVTMSVQKECEKDTVSKEIIITSQTKNLVNLGVDTLICSEDSIRLSAYSPNLISYLWKGGTTDSIQYGTVDIGLYIVAVSDGVCGDVDSIYIQQIDSLHPLLMKDSTICLGDSLTLWAEGGKTYNWEPSIHLDDHTSPHPSVIPDSTTIYFVEISNVCEYFKDSVKITVASIPPFKTESNNIVNIKLGDSIQLFSPEVDSYTYAWSPKNGLSDATLANPVAKPEATTTYQLIIEDQNGCVDTTYTLINVEYQLFIPNAFSPNQDGKNDLFAVSLTGGFIQCFELSIYDRFGKLIYELPCTTELTSWDGKTNGQAVNAGVYVYYVNITFKDKTSEPMREIGNVTILR